MGKLDGQVALITGGTKGIGEAAVRLFGQEGARVVLCGRARQDGERITVCSFASLPWQKTAKPALSCPQRRLMA